MIEVIVANRQVEAEGICSFELARHDGMPLPAFNAGAHIDVHLGNGLVRQYSLCNSASETHRYQIAVLNEPASRGGSQYLHEAVQEGQRLSISEPRNLFALNPAAHRTLLFAGGIGITPILCMAERLSHAGAQFELYYSVRNHDRAAFSERLQASPFAQQVHLFFDDQQSLDAYAVLAAPASGTHLYVCGPGGYMGFILDTARAQGWPEERLHREYFSASPEANPSGSDCSCCEAVRCPPCLNKRLPYRTALCSIKFLYLDTRGVSPWSCANFSNSSCWPKRSTFAPPPNVCS